MEAKKLKNVRLRIANDEDLPFIFNSWLKSFRDSFFSRDIPDTIYFSDHHKIIEKILKNSVVMISCNEDDPTQIYGYAVGSQEDGIFVLHYIYVKYTFRSLGIGTLLLKSFGHSGETASVYTHHNNLAHKLASKYNFIYHPYLMFIEEGRKDGEE